METQQTERSPAQLVELRRQAHLMTTRDHVAVIDTRRGEAEAILPSNVKRPDRPIQIFLQEAGAIAKAARDHQAELGAVGLKTSTVDRLENLLVVLVATQVILHRENAQAELNRVLAVASPARELRDWMLAAAGLALRNHREGLARLSVVKGQKAPEELVSNLIDLAVLAADHRRLFEDEVCMDVDDVAGRLGAAAAQLREALASAGADRHLSNHRELRDRVYTLALQPLAEIRAYASFAFRDEAGAAKRTSFTSQYLRARNRRARSKRKAEAQPGGSASPGPGAEASAVRTVPGSHGPAPATPGAAGRERPLANVG